MWKWYRPIVQQLLAVIAQTVGEIRLIADGTKAGAGHQLLIIAVAFRRRALPIAWTWVRSSRGTVQPTNNWPCWPAPRPSPHPACRSLLVGDSEFGAVEVLRQLDAWGWQYVIRQKGHVLIQVEGQPEWRPLVSGPDAQAERLVRSWAIDGSVCAPGEPAGSLGGLGR